MKILAFVDVHGNVQALKEIVKKAKDVDLMVCCGDISILSRDLDHLISILAKAKKPLLIIPGNHETEEGIERISNLFKFVVNLHQASYEIDNYMFFGYGTGGFSHRDNRLEIVVKKFKKTIKKDSKIILITHAPPYGTSLDRLDHAGHRGSKTIREIIEEIKPVLSLSGHLHENAGNKDKIGDTIIINPGNKGKIIDLEDF